VSTARRFGFWKPFQSICFSFGRLAQSWLAEWSNSGRRRERL